LRERAKEKGDTFKMIISERRGRDIENLQFFLSILGVV
jgi:hypothetical protein